MGIREVTKLNITALNLWLQYILWDLWKDKLTSGLMLPLGQAQAEQNGSIDDKDHQPVLIYENFHTQTIVSPKYLENSHQANDEQ